MHNKCTEYCSGSDMKKTLVKLCQNNIIHGGDLEVNILASVILFKLITIIINSIQKYVTLSIIPSKTITVMGRTPTGLIYPKYIPKQNRKQTNLTRKVFYGFCGFEHKIINLLTNSLILFGCWVCTLRLWEGNHWRGDGFLREECFMFCPSPPN